jgi:hypothetical protein
MSKGKRGIGLDKPCPKCGREVPASYTSPVQEGLCGKCTDEALKAASPRASGTPVPASPGVGGGAAKLAAGIAGGLVAGVLASALASALAPSLWESLVGPLRGLVS